MKRFLTLVGIALFLAILALSPLHGHQAEQASSQQALLTQYCLTCHNDRARTGGLTLENLDADHPEGHAEVWERAIRKLRAGLMPPAGAPRPDRTALENFRHTLEGSIDRAAIEKRNPGVTALHRMNRSEYANAIHDLLAID